MAPQGGVRAVFVAGVDFRRPGHHAVEHRAQLITGIAVQRHYGADVGRHGLHQLDPVADGRRLGELVGQDLPGVVVLQADAGHQSQARALPSAQLEVVPEQVVSRLGVLPQHAVAEPLGEPLGGLGVAPLRVGRPVQPLAGLQVDDVQGVAFHQRLLYAGGDQVVGGAQHVGHVVDRRRIVSPPAEGSHSSHIVTIAWAKSRSRSNFKI